MRFKDVNKPFTIYDSNSIEKIEKDFLCGEVAEFMCLCDEDELDFF